MELTGGDRHITKGGTDLGERSDRVFMLSCTEIRDALLERGFPFRHFIQGKDVTRSRLGLRRFPFVKESDDG